MKDAIEKIQIWIRYFGAVANYIGDLPINFPSLPTDQIRAINERRNGVRPGSGSNRPGSEPETDKEE